MVIDDIRNPLPDHDMFSGDNDVLIARTSIEALSMLEDNRKHGLSALFLDHDLGADDTTRCIASMLEERAFFSNPYPVDTIYIHTSNSVGRKWIADALSRFYRVVMVDAGQFFTS